MKVLVTGATGHVGLALVGELLDAGYTVLAGRHRPGRDPRVDSLEALGAESVHADILDRASLVQAFRGVEAVFHVAGVVRLWAPNPERDIIAANVEGAINVVAAAAEAGVRRVVLTSSVAAVGAGTRDGSALGPEDWNHEAITAYARAKTLAELRARHEADRLGVELVSICPGSVTGPGFFSHTPSTELFSWLERGYLRVVLPVEVAFVDCRGLAKVHRLALERGAVGGRYLAVDAVAELRDVAVIAANGDPSIPVPAWRMAPSLLPLLAFGDSVTARLSGRDRKITTAMLREFADKTVRYDCERTTRDLGWEPMSFAASIEDTIAWIRSREDL